MADYPDTQSCATPVTVKVSTKGEGKATELMSSKITLLEGFEEKTKVPKRYVPDGYKTVEDYLSDVRTNHELDIQADDENRREAIEDKKFAAGEQWDPLVLEHRQGLPCLVLNSVPQFTAQLVGDWRTNRNGIKVVPSENGDADIAQVRGDLIRAIEQESRATRVYDNAFESMIQCGDGAYQDHGGIRRRRCLRSGYPRPTHR
jgi:hypothetical protein